GVPGSGLHAEDTATSTMTPVLLKPTDHPQVPGDLSQFWMVPERGRARTVAQANLAAAVKLENEGNHARALALLQSPATRQDGQLAAYAEFYKGLALLRLGRVLEARTTFQSLQASRTVGYLAEMAALREAESDESLGDRAAALAVYERLADAKTLAPDEVLMKLGYTAQALGDAAKAQAAFERVYYEYPLSDLTDDAAVRLPDVPASADSIKFKQDLARAEKLFVARQSAAARASFERLRLTSQAEDRTVVQLRLAECDYYLRKYRASADALRPFVESGTRPAEALYFYALSQRELKDNALYHTLM